MKTTIPSGLTGKKLFAWLHNNREEIVRMKCMNRKFADPVEIPAELYKVRNELRGAAKAAYRYSNDTENGVLERTIVMNTYLWMDSYDDVHMPNLFAKSLKEAGGKAPHLHDHKFEIAAKVGNPIKWYEGEIGWNELGVALSGTTQALFLESEILKEYNPKIYNEYLKGRIDQHSVFMGYQKVALALNDKDYEEEYKVYKEVIDRIGNKDKVEEQGYFYAIREARLHEGSAVLVGANELTPTLENKSLPETSTEKEVKPKFSLDVSKMVRNYESKLKSK